MVTIIGLLIAISSAGQVNIGPGRPQTPFNTGPRFHQELEKATSGTWDNVELRVLLRNLGNQKGVAMLLDRRIDPTVQKPIDILNRPLKSGFQEIAHKVSAEISVPENVVYVGPPSATNRLRTLIELRSTDLQSKSFPVREARRVELSRRQTFSWEDLDTPREILQKIAEHYHLTIRHSERIPHDLWGGCILPSVTAAEALSLVLNQFDLTFTWEDGGQGIELIPIPDHQVVERRPRMKGKSAKDTLKLIKENFSDIDSHLDGSELVVLGTVEQQEAVAALLYPAPVRKPSAPEVQPLRDRTFVKVRFENVPVKSIMKKFEESGIVFIYDQAALTAAGVDLDQTIDIHLEKANGEELIKAVFTAVKLTCEFENVTVKLKPK